MVCVQGFFFFPDWLRLHWSDQREERLLKENPIAAAPTSAGNIASFSSFKLHNLVSLSISSEMYGEK